MNHLRRLFRALLRRAGFGPEPAATRGGAGFRGVLDANLADIPDIVRFEVPIFRDHKALYRFDFLYSTDEAALTEKYQRILGSPDGGAAIYVTEGRAAGYVAWNLFGADGARQAVVLSIANEPALRGSGIGRALLEHMRKRVVADGAVALRAQVWAHNAPSRALFEAHGFSPIHTEYAFALDDAEAGGLELS